MNICLTGIYRCNNPKKYYHDTNDKEYSFLYHCRNWTFTVGKVDENYIYLYDTYFGDKCVYTKIEDFENDFELVVDLSKFHKVSRNTNLSEYMNEDICQVADCSAGIMNPSKYIRNGAVKDFDRVIELLDSEIGMTENELEALTQRKERLLKEKEREK